MSVSLSRYVNATLTPSLAADLGLPSLAVQALGLGSPVLIAGHRLRLGSPIERLVRTPRASVSCAAASVRARVAAKVRAASDKLLEERRQAAESATRADAAPLARPEPEPTADEQLAAILRNPPSDEDTMFAALRRDAAKGAAQ